MQVRLANALGCPVDLTLSGAVDVSLLNAWRRCRELSVTGRRLQIHASEPRPGLPRANDSRQSLLAMSERLTTAVTVAAITARRFDLLMLHAGAVADPNTGAVVAFIGRSGSGKTTASIALAQSLGYVTDETAAIRDDLSVIPYPKPLSVINPGPDHYKDQVSPDDLGLRELTGRPLRLVALLMLDRDDDHPAGAPAVLEPLHLVDAVPELVAQISFLGARERPLQRVQDLVRACGGLQRVTYRNADSLPAVVTGLLSDPEVSRRLATATNIGLPRPDEPTPTAIPASADLLLYRRCAVDDVIDEGGCLIVLKGDRVYVLDGIAPALWHAAGVASPIDELVRAVVRAHEAPEAVDTTAVVGTAIDSLVSAGILEPC
jgi:hypothetical protein